MVLGSFETPGANVVVSIVFIILIERICKSSKCFRKLKTRRYPSCHDGNRQSLSVQYAKRYEGFDRILSANRWQLCLTRLVLANHCTWLQGWLLITQICCLASDWCFPAQRYRESRTELWIGYQYAFQRNEYGIFRKFFVVNMARNGRKNRKQMTEKLL